MTLSVGRAQNAWTVFDDGKRIGGAYRSFDVATARMNDIAAERRAEGQRRRRPCLTCGREFLSEGPHNRMCACCRGQHGSLPPQMVG